MNLLGLFIFFISMIAWMNIKNIPPHLVLLSSALLFTLLGWIPLISWCNIMFNPSLLTIFFLVLMSGVIKRQPWIYKIQMRAVASVHPSLILCLIIMLSMVINNIPIVMILLPMIHEKVKTTHQKWWIALSYASIFGGMLTLIGTSTNLLVNAWLIEHQYTPLGFFETGLFAFPLTIIATLLLLHDLGKTKTTVVKETYAQLQDHLIGFEVNEQSPLIGLTLKEASIQHLNQSYATLILRHGETVFPLNEHTILHAHDQLFFGGDVALFHHLTQLRGLDLIESKSVMDEVHLVEAMVIQDFHQSIKDIKLKDQLNGIIVGIVRYGQPLIKTYKDVILKAKDTVLIVMHSKDDLHHPAFQQVSRHSVSDKITIKNTMMSILFIFAIILGVFQWVPYVISMPILVILSLINKDITLNALKVESQPKLMLSLYAGLVLAQVFQAPIIRAELNLYLASMLLNIPLWAFIISIGLLTMMFTEVMNNGVAAMMMLSLSATLNEVIQVEFRVLVLMIAILASASFMNVLGYQTHLVVLNAGRLKPAQFFAMGWKYTLLFLVGVVTLGIIRIMM
jgi:di/tricarboxylate transporter